MASTAVSLPNVAEGIAGTYVAQSTEKYISVAMACWFVWDHGERETTAAADAVLSLPNSDDT
ncbi:hypothetical protein FRB91_001093 [Serendipita sp. 411]|nr:hypothetical protein FRC15_002737 [Serendipita sp. 397]KAG8856196.1 hypothetical protein FRB91_001093 [Serendipita sp. 411]KAG8867858.1 hypothetical protein FRC20_004647 [Serendipita sp. 405]